MLVLQASHVFPVSERKKMEENGNAKGKILDRCATLWNEEVHVILRTHRAHFATPEVSVLQATV